MLLFHVILTSNVVKHHIKTFKGPTAYKLVYYKHIYTKL